jgi:multisubunit Na+/H+ antiporter MnhB subunit
VPTAEAILLGLVAVVIVALLARVRRERRHPERPPSAATWVGVGLVLGFTTWAVANTLVSALLWPR